MRTQVVIIGSGPSGLLLGQLLARAGVETIILEQKSQDYVLGRIRAGVLEQGAVALIDEAGAGARLQREGLVHDGTEIAFDGVRHRIDFKALTGKTVTVYGQTEVTRDLMDARAAIGAPTVYEALDVGLHDLETDRPIVRYRKDGVVQEIDCDYIAGCDGFHGVSRRSIPENLLRSYERVYPFGWLGVLVDKPPVSHELIYVNHERGFALCSMRSPTRSRYYLQCRLDEQVDDWSDDKVLGGTDAPPRPGSRAKSADRPLDREEHRAAAQLRRRADALRQPVPRRRRRPYRAADRRQGPEPRRQRRRLSLARADRALRKRLALGLDTYAQQALARVWKAERFSWWMTQMLHRFPESSGFDQKMQAAELDYLFSSHAAQTVLAENYVGLPY